MRFNTLAKISIIFLSIILSACCRNNNDYEIPSLPSHMQPTDPEKLQMEHRLILKQVKIIQEGQYVLISIPSDLLFRQHSPEISVDSYGLLNDVICYLKMFRKVDVQINSHDYANDKQQRIFALTRARASNIAEYMVSQDIDARIIFTRGMANDKPIYNNQERLHALGNSRIDIMFKEEIV